MSQHRGFSGRMTLLFLARARRCYRSSSFQAHSSPQARLGILVWNFHVMRCFGPSSMTPSWGPLRILHRVDDLFFLQFDAISVLQVTRSTDVALWKLHTAAETAGAPFQRINGSLSESCSMTTLFFIHDKPVQLLCSAAGSPAPLSPFTAARLLRLLRHSKLSTTRFFIVDISFPISLKALKMRGGYWDVGVSVWQVVGSVRHRFRLP
jgi:hypothetical protein